MSTSVRLVNPTEDQLDGAFAEHVVGLKLVSLEWGTGPRYWHRIGLASDGKGNLMDDVRRYCQSVDAILPYLEAWRAEDTSFRTLTITRSSHDYVIEMRGHVAGPTIHRGDALARALVIALLRAHGVEITFT